VQNISAHWPGFAKQLGMLYTWWTARARREAIRQLADLRRRLAAAEDALAKAQAVAKQAQTAFDTAQDRFTVAEAALDTAREERAQARMARYAARQAYERASLAADRLVRRVRELSERLDRPAELALAVAMRRRDVGCPVARSVRLLVLGLHRRRCLSCRYRDRRLVAADGLAGQSWAPGQVTFRSAWASGAGTCHS
jgi:uncharacterized protein (DUF3084 family)